MKKADTHRNQLSNRARLWSVLTCICLTPLGVSSAAQSESSASASDPAAATAVRRLTRVEYIHALRDLFGIEVPFMEELPADSQIAGFENNSDALVLTPVLLEAYLKVAHRTSDLVLGLGASSAVAETFPANGNQIEWLPGLPMGTRGGVRIEHYFPRAGTYEIRASLNYIWLGGERLGTEGSPAELEGIRFFRERVRLPAGPHTVFVTFPKDYTRREGPVPNLDGIVGIAGAGGPVDIRASAIRSTLQFWVDGRKIKTFGIHSPPPNALVFEVPPGPPALGSAEISGPFDAKGVTDTPQRRQLLTCTPHGVADERACASEILGRVARRAYRRELTADDMARVMGAFERKRSGGGGFVDAIGMGLRHILISPDFLLRIETDPAGARPGQLHRVSDAELASRLSFFLWSSIPDDQLLAKSRQGELRGVALEREVHRMLADSRADSLVDNFAMQWLDLRNVDGLRPNLWRYFQVDREALYELFQRETRLFLRTVMRENRSILELLSGDFVFVNERLARLYGIEGVTGDAFRKVTITDSRRGGLLSQGLPLMLSSHPLETSPILRGKWVLSRLFSSPPPPPPAGVPPLKTGPAADGRPLTMREQIERHRASPVCSGCHSKMDPYGVALENYDVLGRWRTHENGALLDTTTKLPRGEPFTGPAGLKNLLLTRSEEFAGATVSSLLTYALGRKIDKEDQRVQEIVQAVKPGGYRFVDIVVAVVNSPSFQMRASHSAAQESGS